MSCIEHIGSLYSLDRMGDAPDRRHGPRRSPTGRRQGDLLGSSPPHVLVIDPHEDTRTLYVLVLAEMNCVVYGSSEGLAGVAQAEQRLPDAILTELAVPRLDGFGILDRLQSNRLTADIPVIAVTGLLHEAAARGARQAAFAEVLAKPVEPALLLQSVRDAISRTPDDRRVRRRLRRSLMTLRKLGRHLSGDPQAQERIRKLIDRLQVAVLAFDDAGRYVAASPAVSSLTGYSRTHILSRSIFQVPLVEPTSDMQQRWGDFLSAEHCTTAETVKDAGGASLHLQAAFVTVLPGLHAAAIAPVSPHW
jgi:PAS domain S-box-containing protein